MSTNKYPPFILVVPVFCFGIWDTDTHNINNWILGITNYARFGNFGLWIPESIPFYWGGLLFGAISSTGDTFVTISLNHGAECEYGPKLKGQDRNSPVVRVYMYPYDWLPPVDTFPMAPQIPLTQQESWSCYNDCDYALHIPEEGKSIGIEVYQTSFADTLTSIKDVVYIKYEIKNCTTHTINNAIITIYWAQTMLRWNGLILHKWFYPTPNDSFLIEDLGYYYDDSFAIGILFIKTPDDIGCSAYKTFTGALGPNRDRERYLTMAGYNYKTGAYEPYDSLDFAAFCYMSSGGFSLSPGETKELVIVLLAAPYRNYDTLQLAIVTRNASEFYLDSLATSIKEMNGQHSNILKALNDSSESIHEQIGYQI